MNKNISPIIEKPITTLVDQPAIKVVQSFCKSLQNIDKVQIIILIKEKIRNLVIICSLNTANDFIACNIKFIISIDDLPSYLSLFQVG